MWVEPQPSLMLRPSGSSAITSTSAPRRSKIAGAARWVAPLAQSRTTLRPGEIEREGRLQGSQVVLEASVQLMHAPRLHAGRGLRAEQRLHPRLGLVVELRAPPREELDPVVAVGVVGGGDDRGKVEAEALDEDRGGRGRQNAAEQRVPTGRGDTGREGGLQHRPGLAGVADDEDLWPLGFQRGGRGLAQRRGELRGEERPRLSSDPVGSEEPARGRQFGPQRLLNCGRLRAFLSPALRRSLTRASRVRKPRRFRSPRSSGSISISARAMP